MTEKEFWVSRTFQDVTGICWFPLIGLLSSLSDNGILLFLLGTLLLILHVLMEGLSSSMTFPASLGPYIRGLHSSGQWPSLSHDVSILEKRRCLLYSGISYCRECRRLVLPEAVFPRSMRETACRTKPPHRGTQSQEVERVTHAQLW